MRINRAEILPGLYRFEDSCNVYLLKHGSEAVAIDFGSGRWVDQLSEIGVDRLLHVLITHVHRDQMYGPVSGPELSFDLRVPAGDVDLLQNLETFWKTCQDAGCPSSYLAPTTVASDYRPIGEANDQLWAGGRITAIPTPGHTPGALTFTTIWKGQQVVFCGDALTADGRIHEPHHLEWDHWTPGGANQAWYGLERLAGMRIDLLCPSHGQVGKTRCLSAVRSAQSRVRAFIQAKTSVCAGERDRWFPVSEVGDRTLQVSEHLFLFAGNTYVLLDGKGAAFVIDPNQPSCRELPDLLDRLGVTSVRATTATHYHRDHSDGLNWIRETYDAPVWLHPWVEEPLRDRDLLDVPWLPTESVAADRVLPETGSFRWSTYRFRIRPFPGQTWWHCAFDTEVDGRHVLFSGDNFQPPSRWNGTGGFCSYNGSTMEGFARSAQTVIDLAPDVICNGHGCVYEYAPSHYRKILKWAKASEKAIAELTAESRIGIRACRWEPFRSMARRGESVKLKYVVEEVKARDDCRIEIRVPEGWGATPGKRRIKGVSTGSRHVTTRCRSVGFNVEIPVDTLVGRHLVEAEVWKDGRLIGQPAVAIVDVV